MRLIDATEAATWARIHILDAKEKYEILDFLRECSTIDAVPVKKSFWECYETSAFGGYKNGEAQWLPRKFFRCERCRKGSAIKSSFCPNCGADMGERKDGDGNG